jgi:hypothetical protein
VSFEDFGDLGSELFMGSILPSSMAGSPPDIYVNFKSGQAQYKSGAIVSAASVVTVSRASAATQVDAVGNWGQFASNQLAATGLGASIWEARTNPIRNNTMVGAVAASPGTLPTNWVQGPQAGLTRTVVGTGNVNGVNYVDIRYNGTTSGGTSVQIRAEAQSQIAALYGQNWTESIFLAIVGGTLINISSIVHGFEDDDAGGILLTNHVSSDIKASLTSSLQRFTNSATITNASTAFVGHVVQINTQATSAVDLTIRIGWPQLENNAMINSTVASAVKAADGAGGVNGSGVYSVGGGAGPTTATLNCTWAAGVLTVNSVANAGSYTTFPPSPSTLTYVSGAATGWTGATVTLTPTNLAAQAVASNPILTSGTAATRTAEVDTLVLTGLPAFGAAYSAYVRWTPQYPNTSAGAQNALQLDANVDSQRLVIRRNLSAALLTSLIGGTGAAFAPVASLLQGTSYKVASAVTASDQATVINGGTPGTASAAVLPTTPTVVHLGTNAGGTEQMQGNLEEIAVWFTQRVPNATLQAMTV